MNFENGYIYHIYNQGNNRCKIFFKPENYHYFLQKIEAHILPFAEILAYCLMPNHFHLMVFMKKDDIMTDTMTSSHGISSSEAHDKTSRHHASSHTMTRSHRMTIISNIDTTTQSHRMTTRKTLNNSIAIMLRSYTRAINKQENRSGSLFKAHTKAECVNCPKSLKPSFILNDGISTLYSENPEQQYPNVCFNYIHQNPVKANLVTNTVDWEFSSARDFAGLRDSSLANKKLAGEYGLHEVIR